MPKNYCFTSFTNIDWEDVFSKTPQLTYVGWGEETCPSTERWHQQGWLQIKKNLPFSKVKEIAGQQTAIFACKGTAVQNETYCKKGNSFQCIGVFTTQGARSDLSTIHEMIKNGESMKTIADTHFGDYVRYHRGFEKVLFMVRKESTRTFRKVTTVVYHGETGSGKTRAAVTDECYMMHPDGPEWWDGYEGEKHLVIDEYSNQYRITRLLGLLDGYQIRLPIKGGFTWAEWTSVIITTNLTLLHENAKEAHQLALERRIARHYTFPDDREEVTGNITRHFGIETLDPLQAEPALSPFTKDYAEDYESV